MFIIISSGFFHLVAEKLADCKLNVAEVTQSEIGQKQKLQTVLEAVQELLRPHSRPLQWTVDCKRPAGQGQGAGGPGR